MGESQGLAVSPAQIPQAVPQARRSTVCSTTMGMRGRARAAVTCRLCCRVRPVLGVRCVGKRAARRGPNLGHPTAATRAPPNNIPGHIPLPVRAGFRPMAELQFPACFAYKALSH